MQIDSSEGMSRTQKHCISSSKSPGGIIRVVDSVKQGIKQDQELFQ